MQKITVITNNLLISSWLHNFFNYHKECFFVFVQQIDETVTGGKAQRYREKVATTKKSTIQRQSSLEL